MLRRLLQSSLLALAAVVPFAARAATVPGAATVVAVRSGSAADLVLLDRGFDAGLRQGMICRLARGGADIAEVLLVGLRPTCGAALILNLAPGQSIRAGDVATIKLLKT